MLIYSHNIPEILTSLFYTKDDIKNSNDYCGLINDDFPDDISTLKGDDLIIKEGENTINLDFALAIAFNAIRDCDTAIQFAKILTANGPRVDTASLIFYIKQIQSGPFSYCVRQNMQVHFDEIISSPLGPTDVITASNNRDKIPRYSNDIDNDFKNTLKDLLKDCLTSPCNYFNYGGNYGSLANSSAALNSTTLPMDVPPLSGNRPPGIIDLGSVFKSPIVFGKFIIESSLHALNATYQAGKHFIETYTKPGSASSKQSPLDLLKGSIEKPDTTSYEIHSQASTLIETKLAQQLGDCYRVYDFNKRYNPFDYSQNQQGGIPNTKLQPGNPTILSKDSLNITKNQNTVQPKAPPELPAFALTKTALFNYVNGSYIIPFRLSPYLNDSKERLFSFIKKTAGDIQNNIQKAASGNTGLQWYEAFLTIKNGDLALTSDIESIARNAGAQPYDMLEIKTVDGQYLYGRWTYNGSGLSVTNNFIGSIYYDSNSNITNIGVESIRVHRKAVDLIHDTGNVPPSVFTKDTKFINPPNPNSAAASSREKFRNEINDPTIRKQLYALMLAEVGSQGEAAQLAFVETVFNRANVQGKSVSEIINNKSYYEPYQNGAYEKAVNNLTSNNIQKFDNIIGNALGGSNITRGATQNASGTAANSVDRGGYDADTTSVVRIGNETYYSKTHEQKKLPPGIRN